MQLHFDALIGTGGIGSGRFFALDSNHTLGREESRSGRFLDRRDYCKLHIVAHYVHTLLGHPFQTIAIGRVGDDEAGTRLRDEMVATGLDTRYVTTGAGQQTMYALCFLYPDGSGGNLTVNDSASAHVDAGAILTAEAEFGRFAGRGIAMALPEVPLAARRALLSLGSRYGFFCVASYTTAEILEGSHPLDTVDLLALNLDEAAALAGLPVGEVEPEAMVRAAVASLRPGGLLTVTAGVRGSWSWDGATLTQHRALPVPVSGTAGAGDAHLAGVIVGLAIGLPIKQAHQLGVLAAAVAITSPHTSNDRLSRQALLDCAEEFDVRLPDASRDFLTGGVR
jgi:ribokinase